jgi:hypothetical protein
MFPLDPQPAQIAVDLLLDLGRAAEARALLARLLSLHGETPATRALLARWQAVHQGTPGP